MAKSRKMDGSGVAAWDVSAPTMPVAVHVWVEAPAADAALAPVAQQVFAAALTQTLVQIQYFLPVQQQQLVYGGVVVESGGQESRPVGEWETGTRMVQAWVVILS